ncbi:hypothetical protein Tco_1453740 [Tanacetum coccineum]
MDDFLQLLVWNGMVVSKGDSIPNNQRSKPHVTPPLTVGEPIPKKSPLQKAIKKPDPKIAAAKEKKDKQNLVKAKAKRARERSSAATRNKKAHRNQEPTGFGSENTISITSFHHVAPYPTDETVASVPKNTTGHATIGPQTVNLEKEVVDLSENTRVPTPPITTV